MVLFLLYFISAISETKAQTPSKIIKGMYFISIEAKHAKLAPNKLSNIKVKLFCLSFSNTLRIYASRIKKTPIKPIQSMLFIN